MSLCENFFYYMFRRTISHNLFHITVCHSSGSHPCFILLNPGLSHSLTLLILVLSLLMYRFLLRSKLFIVFSHFNPPLILNINLFQNTAMTFEFVPYTNCILLYFLLFFIHKACKSAKVMVKYCQMTIVGKTLEWYM